MIIFAAVKLVPSRTYSVIYSIILCSKNQSIYTKCLQDMNLFSVGFWGIFSFDIVIKFIDWNAIQDRPVETLLSTRTQNTTNQNTVSNI
jgi:hypothetical protein